jgi:hypothetical protein
MKLTTSEEYKERFEAANLNLKGVAEGRCRLDITSAEALAGC